MSYKIASIASSAGSVAFDTPDNDLQLEELVEAIGL